MWTLVGSLPAILHAQTPPQIPNDEVRVSSRPYTAFRLQAESNLVQVGVVVRDHAGHAVPNLKQTDFKVSENGTPREIVSFSIDGVGRDVRAASNAAAPSPSAPAAPTTPPSLPFIAMYFDDFATAAGELAFTKNAAKQFVHDSLGPNDRVAIVTSSAGRITKDYGLDRQQLTEAIDRVEAHPKLSANGVAICPRITPYDAYKIAILMDETAIHSAMTELNTCGLAAPTTVPSRLKMERTNPLRNQILNQAEQTWTQARIVSQNTLAALSQAVGELYRLPGPKTPGSRILLLVSSGFLTGSLERERDIVIDQSLRAGVVINALDAKGLSASTPGRPFGEITGPEIPIEVYVQETLNELDRQEEPSTILANFAASTGGLYFHHNNGFSQGFRELGAAPETTYNLGFRPDEATLDGKYHKLKVGLVSSNGNSVQARPGYYAVPKSAAPEDAARVELDRQVTGLDIRKDLTAAVDYQPGEKAANGTTPVRVRMHVDLSAIEFPERDGRHLQKLTFVFALLDKDGAIVSAREGGMEFNVTDAKYTSLKQNGVNAVLTLEAPPGVYRLRTVALENIRAKMATLSYSIKIP